MANLVKSLSSVLLLVSIAAATNTPFWQHQQSKQIMEQKRVAGAVHEICFDGLGCFSNGEPWNSFGRVAYLPDKPEDVDTRFYLYTRKNSNEPVKLVAGDVTRLVFSPFDGSKPTKFIVHGYTDWGTSTWNREMAKQFLIHDDVNVFCVDWHGGSQTLYGKASANTRLVAAEIARLVRFLSNHTGLKFEDVHVIGHSMGAHIGGYVGNELKTLGRITGMDPAGPYFQNMDPLVRLDETDANFVEVLHTDGGSILQSLVLEGGFGTWQPSGHVDIYVNGGIKQTGCGDDGPLKAILAEGLIDGMRYIFICPHCRAFEYMTESIGSLCPWRSYSCSNWAEFQTGRCLRCPSDGQNKTCNGVGNRAVMPTDRSYNNMYWMATGPKKPFCRYHYHVQLTLSSKKTKDQKGKLWFKLVGDRASMTGFYLTTEDHILLKHGSIHDFLVTSPNDLGSIKSVEFKWTHDAAWLDITQWQFGTPTIYPKKVTVFSGEHQTEVSYCDNSGSALKSSSSRVIAASC